jgi:hypothetical protein
MHAMVKRNPTLKKSLRYDQSWNPKPALARPQKRTRGVSGGHVIRNAQTHED